MNKVRHSPMDAIVMAVMTERQAMRFTICGGGCIVTDNAPPAESDELLSLSFDEGIARVKQDVPGLKAYAYVLWFALRAERERSAALRREVEHARNQFERLEDQMRRARQELHNTLMTLEEWPQ